MRRQYERAYAEAMRSPEPFWARAAAGIQWLKPWDTVLDASRAPLYRWFSGGELNTCYNAIDYHVAHGRADQAAVIYDSPVTGTCRTLSYPQLLTHVARSPAVLSPLPFPKGHR